MTTRIYAVTLKSGDTSVPRLIRATTQSVALRHAAKDTFSVSVASQDDIVKAMQAGQKVEDAGND